MPAAPFPAWLLRCLATLALAGLCACNAYPRDPEQTLARVQGGVLHAGVVHDPPFVVLAPGQAPSGPEVRLVEAFAARHDARVDWQVGTHDRLMQRLEDFGLDLVVGGTAPDSPWKKRVALSEPFRDLDESGTPVMRVLALPPGENAWQLDVEAYLRSDAARAHLASDAR
ncbi:ABC transporter substrate-binding protein [Marilutibacter aestuarii]|uniref:ABC transporter substrate-binding protein n=1 Tax=Marilutibacter aestuarii TaxID=1706195 RepID=A0A508A5B2_9GAMM|nr:ABC transporter substrate-binding protein [Lysobacter aestuarii]TQD43028.1 ABC transporter substrate-binding protein [Lysobacter aestuarii]